MKNKPHTFTMVYIALVLLLGYSMVQLVGFQAYVSVWAGTLVGDANTALAGIVYILLYLAAVCIAPILILADGLLWLKQYKDTR